MRNNEGIGSLINVRDKREIRVKRARSDKVSLVVEERHSHDDKLIVNLKKSAGSIYRRDCRD